MRILLINNSGIVKSNGDFLVDNKTGSFAKELKELGHEVIFFGQFVFETNNISRFYIKRNGLRVEGLNRKKNKLINYLVLHCYAIKYVIKSDFIYIFYPNSFKFLALLSILFRKKFGLYIRGMNSFSGLFASFLYHNAHIILTVSDHFTRAINQSLNRSIAFTIKPMLSFSKADIIKTRDYRKNETFVLLFLGRISIDKGIIELLHAISILQESREDIILNIVGDGEDLITVKQTIKFLHLEQIVKVLGSTYDSQEIARYYTEADLYILPSHHEGFPRTLYEAMIFGTPIITSFVGGISSIMVDHFNCLKIKEKSIDDILNKLMFALNNYDDMILFAKNGKNTIFNLLEERKVSHAQQLNNYI